MTQLIEKYGIWIVTAIALLLYCLAIGHGFVLDDNLVITSNSHILEGFAGIPDLFKYNYAHGHGGFNDGLYRPLSLVTFSIEKSLFDLNPSISHFIQALLYALAVFLIAAWLRKLFTSESQWWFWITLLFAVHPMHTEVVANLKSRDEILALLFFAGAAFVFTKWLQSQRLLELVMAAILFLLSCFSKESAVTFIVIFPLITWYKSIPASKALIGSSIMIVPVGIFLGMRQVVLSSLPEVDSGVSNLLQNSLIEIGGYAERLATSAAIQGLYLQKLFIPIQLSHDYSFNAIPVVGLTDPIGLFWIIVMLGLIGLGVYGMLRKTWWSFGILFYFATIAVVANLFLLIGAIAAERFVFTPSLGWCIAVVTALHLIKPLQKHRTKILLFTSAAFISLTAMRIPDWKSNYTLFTTDVETVPNSARAHYNAGSALIDEAKVNRREAVKFQSEAKAHLRKAIEIWPEYQDAYNNLGIAYMNSKDFENAYRVYNDFIKKFPSYVKVRYNMGSTCYQLKKYDEAETNFEVYLEANPDQNDALFFLAECEGFQQKFTEAIMHIYQLIELEPNNERGYLKLGMAYGITGQLDLAEPAFLKAIELNPSNADCRFNLAIMYVNRGQNQVAITQLELALKADPVNIRAQQLLTELKG
jgi:protein O-mannosyl-transferase